VNPRSTSNQSSKPCTVLQYPSRKAPHCPTVTSLSLFQLPPPLLDSHAPSISLSCPHEKAKLHHVLRWNTSRFLSSKSPTKKTGLFFKRDFAFQRAYESLPPHCTEQGQRGTSHCNTLQHAATRCNTLQHTATHCARPSRYLTRVQSILPKKTILHEYEPYVHPKEPYTHSKELYTHSKELYTNSKRALYTNKHPTELCIHSKEPYTHSKEPYPTFTSPNTVIVYIPPFFPNTYTHSDVECAF